MEWIQFTPKASSFSTISTTHFLFSLQLQIDCIKLEIMWRKQCCTCFSALHGSEINICHFWFPFFLGGGYGFNKCFYAFSFVNSTPLMSCVTIILAQGEKNVDPAPTRPTTQGAVISKPQWWNNGQQILHTWAKNFIITTHGDRHNDGQSLTHTHHVKNIMVC